MAVHGCACGPLAGSSSGRVTGQAACTRPCLPGLASGRSLLGGSKTLAGPFHLDPINPPPLAPPFPSFLPFPLQSICLPLPLPSPLRPRPPLLRRPPRTRESPTMCASMITFSYFSVTTHAFATLPPSLRLPSTHAIVLIQADPSILSLLTGCPRIFQTDIATGMLHLPNQTFFAGRLLSLASPSTRPPRPSSDRSLLSSSPRLTRASPSSSFALSTLLFSRVFLALSSHIASKTTGTTSRQEFVPILINFDSSSVLIDAHIFRGDNLIEEAVKGVYNKKGTKITKGQ